MKFEKREVNRTASTEERSDLMSRLLEVLNSIDETREEAKAAAADFRGIIGSLEKREIGLRFNLQTGTVSQEIEVCPMANESTGMMEYFNRDGIEVTELRHPMSEKQKEQEALQRQMDMFGVEQPGEKDEFSITSVTVSTNRGVSVTLGDTLPEPPDSIELTGQQLAELGMNNERPDAARPVSDVAVMGRIYLGSAADDLVVAADLSILTEVSAPNDREAYAEQTASEGDGFEFPADLDTVAGPEQTEPSTAAATPNIIAPTRKNGRFVKRGSVTA